MRYRRPSNSELLNLGRTACSLFAHRELIAQLVRRNIQIRYRGTVLGLAWMLGTPLLMLAVYTFVFGFVFKMRWGTGADESRLAFALAIFCGLAMYNVFSESLNSSVLSIVQSPNYVKKIRFPLELLPVSFVLCAFLFGLVWIAILIVGVLFSMDGLSVSILCLPLLLLPLFLFSCGCAWMVAALGVYVRDVAHALTILLQMMFFMTPVIYKVDMVPERLRAFLYLNPMTFIVEECRGIVISGEWLPWGWWALFLVFSLAVFQVGYWGFMRAKPGFADVL